MKEVSAEALEKANQEYESRRAAGEKISIPAIEKELGIPPTKLQNYRSNKGRVKSVLNVQTESGVSSQLVKDWPLDRIQMRGNARTEFEQGELEGLANSLRATNGELQFAVGYEEEIDGELWCVLIIGERRFRANLLRRNRGEDVTTMPVRMIAKPSEKEFMKMNLVENNQRVNLKPSEEASWLRDMLELVDDESGQPLFSQASLAEEVGMRREDVTRSLKCLEAPREALKALDERKVSVAVVSVIGGLPSESREQATKDMVFGLAGSMTEKEARSHVSEHYRRDLRRGDFDPEDGELTVAGSCKECPWWGGKRDDVGGRASVHQCLNPSCFQEKQAAQAEREKERILGEGGDVVILSDEDSGQLFDGVMGRLSPTCGYVDLDLKVDPYFLVDGDRNKDSAPKWRQALKGDMPTIYMAWDGASKKHELVETRLAMVAALAGPMGMLFRADAAKGVLTKQELADQNRIKNAVKKEGVLVCVDGARALMESLAAMSFDSAMVLSLIETTSDQAFKPDDFIFLCEMLEPDMPRSEMTGRGFIELLKSKPLGVDEMLALLTVVLQVRSLRYKGFEPWCEDGPMADLCKLVSFDPTQWTKTWHQRRTVAERTEKQTIEKEYEEAAQLATAAQEGGEV